MVECLICANEMDDSRLPTYGSCNHGGVCSLCYLRMRSLSRDMRCPICKTTLEHVVCTDLPNVTFESFPIWGDKLPDFDFDAKSSMFFPREYYKNKVQSLWRSQCSICQSLKRDAVTLRKHVTTDHNQQMCLLCIENKHAFPSEHRVYTAAEYDRHLKKGDKDGSEGHPNCEFCRRRYYDKGALFVHLSKDHFTCHICERDGIRFKYFDKYDSLEKHFKSQHFICEEKECLEKKFVVFSNEIDLMTHTREHHPFSPVSRSIPIHFKSYRPSTQVNLMEYARGGGGGAGGEEFDAGMGGRASQGEWQVELGNIAPDPRDALRRQRETENTAVNSLAGARPPRERSVEDYPSLPVASSAQQLRLGSSKSSSELSKITGGGSDESTLNHMTRLGVIKVDKRLQNRAKGTSTSSPSTQAPQQTIKYYGSAVASNLPSSSQSSSSSSSNWSQPNTTSLQNRYASHLLVIYLDL